MMRRFVHIALVFAVCGLSVLACDRAPKEPENTVAPAASQSAASSQSAAMPAQAQPAPANKEDFRVPGAKRLVAIGDLHGDLAATKRALVLAGAIDEQGAWVGKDLVIVQTGDQLDRGNDEAEILSLLKRLQEEARSAGGAVHVLNGNHEAMNVLGDFRYVTPQAFAAFDGASPPSPHAAHAAAEMQGRAGAFLPGGAVALELAERPLILVVGDTAFAHAGILPAHVRFGIDRLNQHNAAWMRGEKATPPALVMDPDGPLWTRIYGAPTLSPAVCAVLDETLQLLGVRRLVIGHTVQEQGMSGACDDRVFRIDVGLSRYYGERRTQVLEITADGARILGAP